MAQTKQSIRRAWDKEHLKTYAVAVHKENEKDVLDYVERQRDAGKPVSAVFKEGIKELIAKERG